MSEPRIVIVGFPSAQILDITGPLEVFSTASRFLPIPRYATQLVSTDGGPVLSTSGLEFATDPIDQVIGTVDTLVVSGGETWMRQHPTRSWSTTSAGSRNSRRVTSVCSGAFLLAAAGLLDGRRATTHWAECADLERDYPRSPSSLMPSTCRMATSGPRPGSPRASISRWRWSPTTTAERPRPPLLAALSCTCAAPADRHSSRRCSPRSPRTMSRSGICWNGSPTTSRPTSRFRRWRRALICPIGSSVVFSSRRSGSRRPRCGGGADGGGVPASRDDTPGNRGDRPGVRLRHHRRR